MCDSVGAVTVISNSLYSRFKGWNLHIKCWGRFSICDSLYAGPSRL